MAFAYIPVNIIPEVLSIVFSLILQYILSISDAVRVAKRVGSVILGHRLMSNIKSKKSAKWDFSFIFRRLIFQSPPIMTSAFFLFSLFKMGSISLIKVFILY